MKVPRDHVIEAKGNNSLDERDQRDNFAKIRQILKNRNY